MLLNCLKQQIVKLRYFYVSANYIPDITYTGQLRINRRHVNMTNYEQVEYFPTFFQISSHTVQNLLIFYFSTHPSRRLILILVVDRHIARLAICLVNISVCSKSGRTIKDSLVEYIPCAGHSMNLGVRSAMDCC